MSLSLLQEAPAQPGQDQGQELPEQLTEQHRSGTETAVSQSRAQLTECCKIPQPDGMGKLELDFIPAPSYGKPYPKVREGVSVLPIQGFQGLEYKRFFPCL